MKRRAVVGENLSRLFSEGDRNFALTLYELSELARLAAERVRGLSLDERERVLSEMLSHYVQKLEGEGEAPDAYAPFFKASDRAGFSIRAAAFSVFLCELEKEGARQLPFRERRVGAPRICYVKGARTDALYLALSARRTGVSVSYAERSEDAVRAVASERADYALLPFALDGERLAATLSLVDRHELCLAGTMDVKEGEGVFTYALFSKACAPFEEGVDMRLDVRLTADEFATLGTVFSTLSAFGFRGADFLPEKEEYGRACGRVTLQGDGNLPALWLYLSFLSVGASFLGRYPHLVI